MGEEPIQLCDLGKRLVDGWQRDFPLHPRPYAQIGDALGWTEAETIAEIKRLIDQGAVSRVGAVVRPHSAGASTLAAVQAPREKVEEIGRRVASVDGVNHCYEREHDWNVWFVVTGSNPDTVSDTLKFIEGEIGLQALDLPMERAYHIDLGFPLFGPRVAKSKVTSCKRMADDCDRALLGAMEQGLSLTPRPFAEVGLRAGMSEETTLDRLEAMLHDGVVMRLGLVMRHAAFGYRANAMTVWDVDDAKVDEIGDMLSRESGVTLCYRRPRRPGWRFNLFTMIHGRDRQQAQGVVDALGRRVQGAARSYQALFSTRCFVQRGARFSSLSRGVEC
jgi:DNA-binding Lrp family transcriptional regulator